MTDIILILREFCYLYNINLNTLFTNDRFVVKKLKKITLNMRQIYYLFPFLLTFDLSFTIILINEVLASKKDIKSATLTEVEKLDADVY